MAGPSSRHWQDTQRILRGLALVAAKSAADRVSTLRFGITLEIMQCRQYIAQDDSFKGGTAAFAGSMQDACAEHELFSRLLSSLASTTYIFQLVK